jgi:hypothetical protein
LISIVVSRAGTYPVLDMPYYTPTIYIFSVLEVNIAIIAASIPTFWPILATLATNKIWVVNEIEIRIENTVRGSVSTGGDIDLEERGPWTKLDSKEEFVGQARRVSVTTKPYDRTADPHTHRHKESNASSIGRPFGLETGPRSSNDSQRKLCRIPSTEAKGGNGSVAKSEREDWFADVGRQSIARTTTTKSGTTDVPFEEMKKREK